MKSKKYLVSNTTIQRFVDLNEALREATAKAEGEFFTQFPELSLMQINIIRTINYHKPCTMGQISKSTNLTLGSVTSAIDGLVAKEYVKRIPSLSDRRIIYAELAAKGEKVINASIKHVTQVAKNIFEKFSKVEQEHILQFLQRMIG